MSDTPTIPDGVPAEAVIHLYSTELARVTQRALLAEARVAQLEALLTAEATSALGADRGPVPE